MPIATLMLTLIRTQAPSESAPSVERRVAVMGTTLALRVSAPTRQRAIDCSERALKALEAVEARLSTWRPDSELARLDRAPVGVPFALTEDLRADLELALACARETECAFDPGVGALVEAWGLRGPGRIPSQAEIASALVPGGAPAALELLAAGAVRRHAALRIEEGGFGKGVGLAAALTALRDSGATAARLDLGGQVVLLGEGTTWGIADPRERARAVLRVRLDEGSFATSGNSENARVVEGRRIGHLIDPRTGQPAPDFGSASVWSRDPARADAFSTAAFVMGPERALAWAARRRDVELIVIETQASGLRVRATAGLRERLEPAVDGVRLEFIEAVQPAVR